MRTLLAAGVILAALAAGAAVSPAPGSSPDRIRAVVHAWSDRLNAGDDDGVAHLFRLPAVVVQNDVFRFRTFAQLAEFHRLLPCSGRITSLVVKGDFATAVFRLGDRRGSPCDSRGAFVAARFEIVGGKIVRWVQIAVPESQKPFASTTA
jgi:ketosteroid isomerase-like protein